MHIVYKMKNTSVFKAALIILVSLSVISGSSINVQTNTIEKEEIILPMAPNAANEILDNLLEQSDNVSLKVDSNSSEIAFLLPNSIRPLHYKLVVLPLLFPVEDNSSSYFKSTLFSAPGKVWIRVLCLEKTNNITLHAHKDLKIEQDKIMVSLVDNGETVSITSVTRNNDTDFLVLHLAKSIGNTTEGNQQYEIFIEFTARVADDRLNGLYLDYYVDPKTKEKRYLSTTLFAPNHARKAFPCFDEPGFKANFSITIGRKDNSGYSSISNMPLDSTKPINGLDGWVWDEFQETVPLPTYLVALITTDFGYRSIKDGDLELKLHAPNYLIKRLKTLKASAIQSSNHSHPMNPYLLQDPLHFIATHLKAWNHTMLGFYPLPKLDIIALPHFFFNAMENFGAITFKYPVILNVENVTTTSELLRLSFVAAHEVMHTWFGTILTPKSWTYVWLKESFSDLFARMYLSRKLNSVDKRDDFVNTELQKAMSFDSSADTHPLENHVKTAASVGEIYTDIPYRKGASIMNMARTFLTDEVFIQGLESLFMKWKYSNIDQYDLFDHLEQAQKSQKILKSQGLDPSVTVTDILNTWTRQKGYPVIRYRRQGSKIYLQQEKFRDSLQQILKANKSVSVANDVESGEVTTTENPDMEDIKNEFWWVPIPSFQSNRVSTYRDYKIHWIPPNKDEIEINLEMFHSITNAEGYFRILYGRKELHSILQDLFKGYAFDKFGAYQSHERGHSMQAVERSQFLDDFFSLAFANYQEVPVNLLFHILSIILPHESEPVVWNTFFQNIQKPYKLLQNTRYFEPFKRYLIELLRPLHFFLASQKTTTFSYPCSRPSLVTRKMQLTQFSALVLSWLCEIDTNSHTCQNQAKEAVLNFVKTEDPTTILADEQTTLYCAAVRNVAPEEELSVIWSFFEKMYFQEYFSVQRDRYLKALSCTGNETYLLRLLDWTTNDTLDFHDVDRVTLLKNVISNPTGRNLILDFLDTNFDKLYKSASVANPVTEALKTLVEYVNTQTKLDELEAFIAKHKVAIEKKQKFLEKQVNKAKYNVLWVTTFAHEIGESASFHLKTTFSQDKQACSNEDVITDFNEYVSKITDW